MKYIKQFKLFLESNNKEEPISDVISRMKLPKDIKEVAIEHISSLTKNRKGKVFGLRLHKDLLKKYLKRIYQVVLIWELIEMDFLYILIEQDLNRWNLHQKLQLNK